MTDIADEGARSLIEKLRSIKLAYDYKAGEELRMTDAEVIASKLTSSDAPVIDRKGLQQQIEVALALGRAKKVDPVEALLRVVSPYLRATEPVSIDIDAGARAIQATSGKTIGMLGGGGCRNLAVNCLKAALRMPELPSTTSAGSKGDA